jgi:ribonuclease BN (tRNA processing enzyme)
MRQGAELLLLEATYVEPGPDVSRHGHTTGEQAAVIAQRAGARRLLLTHLGPWEDRNMQNLHRASARFGGAVELVREGAIYHTDPTSEQATD